MLKPLEWHHVSGLLEILQPLTEELSGDSFPFFIRQHQFLHYLESHLTSCIQHKTEGIMIARNLLTALKSKFSIYKGKTRTTYLKYLGIPVTQVSSERLFSKQENIVMRRQHNLLEHVNR
ncbi:hypothetical protein PR048_019533 [Dryococelus australis]|uniref:HAT C-terminal dimerisation domain-containing protein n=1 Tax=Dryococelus australis TaxID=614101 RepID=A0ABQ9H3S5_9NEOP|nr:hypothetical protein PR048_019533 [Dryococelus australis]